MTEAKQVAQQTLWQQLICIFTHKTERKLVPVDFCGRVTVYRYLPLCRKCDGKLLDLLSISGDEL